MSVPCRNVRKTAVLVAGFLMMVNAAPVVAGESALDWLASMSSCQLEALYRAASPGAIPCGRTRGKAIYCANEPLVRLKSATVGCIWRGKVFIPDGTLVNQWTGVRAIRAHVYEGTSWFDGGPAIVMDYQGISHVWNDVRDEIREVCPGVYLGLMYRRHECGARFKMFFALEVVPEHTCSPCEFSATITPNQP